MEMEYNKPTCPVIDVDGTISGGKQFDLNIMLPEDNRDVIYGVVKNCFKEPVCDAVVKLVEVACECGKEERRPIGHTITDKEGEFVFGPLCPGRKYAIQIWANATKKIKICAKCFHEGHCLKGEKHDKYDCFLENDKHDKCEKCDKYDKCEKYDKYDKCEKYDKYDKCDKCEKHEEYDKCHKVEKCEEYNKCPSLPKNCAC